MLPIFPLDGSKIFNIIFNKFFAFKFSLYLTSLFSFLLIFILSLNKNFNLLLVLTLFFLFLKNIKEIKNIKYVFNRFLLERRFKSFNFKKSRCIKIKGVKMMKRDYYHLFFVKNKYMTEKEMLKKMFDLNGIL